MTTHEQDVVFVCCFFTFEYTIGFHCIRIGWNSCPPWNSIMIKWIMYTSPESPSCLWVVNGWDFNSGVNSPFKIMRLTEHAAALLTALRRTVALYSSPMVLSWLATLLTSNSRAALSLGALFWLVTQDGCSLWGSRSGRGPCPPLASWCSSLSESMAQKRGLVN